MLSKKQTAVPFKISALFAGVVLAPLTLAGETLEEVISEGKAYGNFNLRSAIIDQETNNASALTLRSRLGYVTGSKNGFSATLEVEDSRIALGQNDFTVGPTGFNPGEHSVVADPETTEVDQAFIQYKNDMVTTKIGRQVFTLDDHRFVGHVGWRQDRQTFDAASVVLTPAKDLTVTYAFLDKRNRIFAEAADIDSSDHILHASYKTPVGTLKGYAHLLSNQDNDSDLDTYGVSFAGAKPVSDMKILYGAEYATQETSGNNEADYLKLEGGAEVSGITGKLRYEVLGSDDGAYGFSTPLSTLHKFNGWADLFLGTPGDGLVDLSLSVSGKLGAGKFLIAYHDFEADQGGMHYGDEINMQYLMKFNKNYSGGVKMASYSSDEFGQDTDKFWIWGTFNF